MFFKVALEIFEETKNFPKKLGLETLDDFPCPCDQSRVLGVVLTPYWDRDDVGVPKGVALTIEPGAWVGSCNKTI